MKNLIANSYKHIISFLFVITVSLSSYNVNGYCVDYSQDVNCMGYWPMEADGNEPDLSGEGGTLVETSGDIPQSTEKKFGIYSRDFEFDDSEYLTHGDGESTDISGSNQELSIVMWIRLEEDGYETYPVSKADANGDWQYAIYTWTNDTVGFYLYNGSEMDTYTTSTLSEDTWSHIGAVYNDTDGRMYFDGSQDGSPDNYTAGIDDTSVPFVVGAITDGGGLDDYIDAMLDDVAIFDRELSSVEISDIETNGVAGAAASARRIISVRFS